ncbi:MAG: phospholipase D family protein [Pseudomonadota bacterium]
MSEFLHNKDLHKAIKDIAAEPGAKCAVAFWGKGSEMLVSSDAQVICNLKTGGSNPHALKAICKRLKPGNLLQCDILHAKVYLGRSHAVIASANASANGLGLENGEQATWLEAGVSISDVGPVSDWFDALWEASREINDADWEDANAAWAARQRRKPTLRSFLDFDITQGRLPMVLPLAHDSWEVNEQALTEFGGLQNLALRERIENGEEVFNPEEKLVMENRWNLYWNVRKGAPYHPTKKQSLFWNFMGTEVLEDGFKWEGSEDYSDVLLRAEEQPPEPFEVNTPAFMEAFRNVIIRSDFDLLRDYDGDGSWYKKAEECLSIFWAAVKEQYVAQLHR